MKLTDEKILELKNNARREWNYRADQYNQWDELGRDEQDLEFARAILKEAGVEELERDAERLDWKTKHPEYSVYGSDERGWVVRDQLNGLAKMGEGKTSREAIDEAMKAK